MVRVRHSRIETDQKINSKYHPIQRLSLFLLLGSFGNDFFFPSLLRRLVFWAVVVLVSRCGGLNSRTIAVVVFVIVVVVVTVIHKKSFFFEKSAKTISQEEGKEIYKEEKNITGFLSTKYEKEKRNETKKIIEE